MRPWLSDKLPRARPPDADAARGAGVLPGAPGFEYIVVDEIELGVAVLIVERWPRVEDKRLRFGAEEDRIAAFVTAAALQARLANRHPLAELPEADLTAFVARPVRVGDVFAADVDRTRIPADASADTEWLLDPIYDVTREAREAAKVQYYAAVGPVLSADEAAAMAAENLGLDATNSDGES
jgi:hypothetical protein